MIKYLRTKITRLIFNSKRRFILTKLDINRNNPKKFWREINTLIKGSKSNDTTYRLLDRDTGELVVCGGESIYINEFYVNVGKSVHLADTPNDMYPIDMIPQCGEILDFEEFTNGEIIKLASDIEIENQVACLSLIVVCLKMFYKLYQEFSVRYIIVV